MAKNLVDRLKETFALKRFGDDLVSPTDLLEIGLAGNEQNWQPGPSCLLFARDLSTVHAGHREVDQQEIDGRVAV